MINKALATSPYKLKRAKKTLSKQKDAEEAVHEASSFNEAVLAGVQAVSVHDDKLIGQARGTTIVSFTTCIT